MNMRSYDKALDNYSKALDIDKELTSTGLANDYTNIGIVLQDMGNYQEGDVACILAKELKT